MLLYDLKRFLEVIGGNIIYHYHLLWWGGVEILCKKIGSSHTLNQTILLKENNKDVTEKASNKITSIKNITTQNYNFRQMGKTCVHLQKIEDYLVYKTESNLQGKASAKDALSHTQNLLKNKVQSDVVSSLFDTLTLPLICNSVSEKISKQIIDFSCLDSLFRYIKEIPGGNFKAITKMARMSDNKTGHYTCIDVLKNGSKLDLVVYESACIQGDAGPYHGVKCLRELLDEQFHSGERKQEDTRIGIIEMGIQRSSYDCAIFSVSTAKNLYKNNDFSKKMFSKLKVGEGKFNLFYESTAKKIIIAPGIIKQEIDLPPLFLKHSTSKSGVISTDVENEIVNEKNETLRARIEKNSITINGVTYSNSIELKRYIYLQRLNKEKQ